MARESTTREIGDYILERPKIGQGSYANVYKGYRKTTKERVAIKAIFLNNPKLTKKILENLEFEIKTLSQIDNEYIIRLYDIKKTSKHTFLFLEYCGGGDLSQIIKDNGPLSESTARRLLTHLALGLQRLQKANIVHRDLKPQNLLLTTPNPEEATLKIADFGLARVIDPKELAETMCGSPLYMAPEILRQNKYTAKADLWSVGAILYEMLFKKPPFMGNNLLHLIRVIENEPLTFPNDIACSAEAKSLITGLLQRDPDYRYSFEQFFSHPFLQLNAAASQSSPSKPLTSTSNDSAVQSMHDADESSNRIGSPSSSVNDSGRGANSTSASDSSSSTAAVQPTSGSSSAGVSYLQQPSQMNRARSDSNSSLDSVTSPSVSSQRQQQQSPNHQQPETNVNTSNNNNTGNNVSLLNQQLANQRTDAREPLRSDLVPAAYPEPNNRPVTSTGNATTYNPGGMTIPINRPYQGDRATAGVGMYVYDNGAEFAPSSISAPIPIPSRHTNDDSVGSSHSVSPASGSLDRSQRSARPPKVPPWKEGSGSITKSSPPQYPSAAVTINPSPSSAAFGSPPYTNPAHPVFNNYSHSHGHSTSYPTNANSVGNNAYYQSHNNNNMQSAGGYHNSPNSGHAHGSSAPRDYMHQLTDAKLDGSLDIERDYVMISSSDDVEGLSSIVSMSGSGHVVYPAVILDFSNLDCDRDNADMYTMLLEVEARSRQAWAIAEFAVIKETSIQTSDRIEAMALYIKCLDLLNSTYQYSKAIVPSPRAVAVSKWLKKKFLHFFDRAEQLGNKMSADNNAALYASVRIEKILYKYALDLARSSAVEEFLHSYRNCEATYSRAHLVLEFLLLECSLDSGDRSTLLNFKYEVKRRLDLIMQRKGIKS